MVRRLTPAQYQAELRRIAAKQKQTIDKYNREVKAQNRKAEAEAALRKAAIDKHNREVKAQNRKAVADANRAISNYNRKARAHNAKVRQNRERRQAELNRLQNAANRSTRSVSYGRSVDRFQQSFQQLETSGAEDRLQDDLFDLSEGEAANSAAALNALLADDNTEATEVDVEKLKQTTIERELADIDPDPDQRWKGALYSLDPKNPDAARHFCTSAREMLDGLLETAAPDDDVIAANPEYIRTDAGSVSRRARIQHCLVATGAADEAFIDFVEEDIDNVIALFGEFNSGPHGSAGRFGLDQLRALKARVEEAIKFVYRIARPHTAT